MSSYRMSVCSSCGNGGFVIYQHRDEGTYGRVCGSCSAWEQYAPDTGIWESQPVPEELAALSAENGGYTDVGSQMPVGGFPPGSFEGSMS